MNATTSPPIPNVPKNCGLAIWSLVLGILGLTYFCILTAIPAVICGHLALARIKRSAGALTGNGLAIGGLVTGYVGVVLSLLVIMFLFLLVIPTLTTIAIPNFVKARETAQRNGCINNLRMIDSAKQQWALENKKEDTAMPAQSDVVQFLRDQRFPVCPAGGAYLINAINQEPVCSMPNHQLPAP